MSVTCIVHTRNSARTIARALASVAWADELIVADMESEDETRSIAAEFTDQVRPAPRADRVDGVRNLFIAQASHPWVLVVDSDETLPADGEAAVRQLIADHGEAYDAFEVPRFNRVGGQVMRCLWYTDHQLRLFRKGTVEYHDSHHEPPRVKTGPARVMRLEPPDCLHIHHDSHESIEAFVRKQTDYALTQTYDPDPEGFCFEDYVAQAYHFLSAAAAVRAEDGDTGQAFATILAWSAIAGGLIHWERLDPRPPLPPLFSLPIVPTSTGELMRRLEHLESELAAARASRECAERELQAMRATRVWRTYVWLEERLRRVSRILARR